MKLTRIAAATALIGAGGTALGVGRLLGGTVVAGLRGGPVPSDGPDPALESPGAAPYRTHVHTADGAELNVLTYPADDAGDTADVVVFVHGWACNTTYWNPQVNHLLGRRTVVTFDQRGHGESRLGRARPTTELLGKDLEAVLAAVVPPGRKAVLVGHSLGGITIQAWADAHADEVNERISAVVLQSTAATDILGRHRLFPADRPAYTKPFEHVTGVLFVSTPVPLPHTKAGPQMARYTAMADTARGAHVVFVEEMLRACSPFARGLLGSGLVGFDVRTGTEALTVPTTVMVGTEDKLLPPVHAQQIADILAGVGALRRHVVLDGIGHMLSIEASAAFNDALDEIIDADKAPAKKAPAKKPAAKKPAAKKTVANKTVANKTVANKTVANKAPAKNAPAKKAAAKTPEPDQADDGGTTTTGS